MRNVDRLNIREVRGGAVICVKVVPGSSRDKVIGVLGESLKIATSAAAEKGKANAAVARTLANALKITTASLELIAGHSKPYKEFLVVSLSPDQVRRKLQELQ